MKRTFQVLAENRSTHLAIMGLMIFFSRMLLLSRYGLQMPYFDDWPYIGYFVFKPYLEGGLSISDLVAAANEHRIFFTRIAWLSILEVTGFWDAISKSILNSFINVTGLLIFIKQALKPLSGKSSKILIFLFTVFLALPVGWINILWGIQSLTYFMIFFSCISLCLCIGSETFSNRWLAGIFFGICAFFSFSNGAMVFPVILLFSCIRFFFNLEERWRSTLGCLISLMIFIVLVGITPTIERHWVLRAQSVPDFLNALYTVSSWPFMKWRFHSFFIWAPTAALALHLYKKGFPKEDKATILLALSIWVFSLDCLFAYGRAADPINVRYLDFIMLGMVSNTAAAFVLLENLPKGFLRRIALTGTIAMLAWLSVWIVKWVEKADRNLNRWKNDYSVKQIENVRGYMLTGDSAFLYPARKIHVPFRSYYLKQYLDIDEIRGILPAEFGSTEAERSRSIEKTLLKGALSGVTGGVKDLLLGNALYCLVFFGALHVILFLSLIWNLIKNPTHD